MKDIGPAPLFVLLIVGFALLVATADAAAITAVAKLMGRLTVLAAGGQPQ